MTYASEFAIVVITDAADKNLRRTVCGRVSPLTLTLGGLKAAHEVRSVLTEEKEGTEVTYGHLF